jgi:predicted outer membrane repeat protein
VDGTDAGSNNPLQLTLTAHTNVQAIFFKEFVVDDFSDATGSATEEGTLRHAMTNAQDYDVIHLDKETAGATVIELTARLPDITRNITIEGNGVTITRASTWTTTSNASQLMRTNGGTSTISRIWFKDGRATAGGAAINAPTGTLTLESCIFSGNRTSDSNGNGGAIVKAGTGTLNVKGCTFYDNSAYQGGAIYVNGGTLTLTGNLFYGNTATVGPVVYRYDGTVTSNGYNVVNVALGTTTAQSGFSNTNDKTIAAILGDNATTPFTNTTTLAPKSELSSATYGIPAATWTVGTGATAITASMPSTDFYGETRTWPGAPGAVR